MDRLDRTIGALREAEKLQQQLLRQLEVKSRHGIDAHRIQTIVLVPSGRAWSGRITYSSAVTMKNGDELFLPDVNIKAELDGKEGERDDEGRETPR